MKRYCIDCVNSLKFCDCLFCMENNRIVKKLELNSTACHLRYKEKEKKESTDSEKC